MKQEVNTGDYFIYTGKNRFYGDTEYSAKVRKDRSILRAGQYHPYGVNARFAVHVLDAVTGEPTGMVIESTEIQKVEKEEALASIEIEKKKLKAKAKEMVKLVLKGEEKVLYSKRVVKNVISRDILNTNYNFVHKGRINQDESGLIDGCQIHNMAVCCSLTKCTNDLLIHIPVFWTDYYGYTRMDVERYIKLLNESEIGINVSYLGIGEAPKQMVCIPDKVEKGMYMLPENKFYKLLLRDGKSSLITYMFFILIRYMYNSAYWNIPVTALKIKKALKDKISNFQCILLAHMRENYGGYYNLVDQGGNGGKVKVFQDISRVKARLRASGTTMNGAWEYHVYTNDQLQMMEGYFVNEDWTGLLDMVIKREGITLPEKEKVVKSKG